MRKKYEIYQVTEGGKRLAGIFNKDQETIVVKDCKVIRSTEKAWLIKPASFAEDEDPVWIPKSNSILHTHQNNKALHDVEIPIWIAKDKGLDE